MRLNIVKSKNAQQFYVIKSYRENGKNTSKIVEKLGTLEELSKIHEDPIAWAKEYINQLNMQEAEDKKEIVLKYSNSKLIDKNQQVSFNGGYLFLQCIYHKIALNKICKSISSKYKFDFNLDCILSRLIYSRILFPASKLATFDLSTKFIEQPDFELHQIYRALDVIAKESDFIQSELYKNSLNVVKRNTGILYYDCTNFFFETEEADGIRQYGISKDHRPNPLVQMGLFMDGNGLPLAFSITPGNTNEQQTLKPLEKKIISDFGKSKFVVCTDAGLASIDNRKFNNISDRAFVTTQSIKKLKSYLKEWALSPDGWTLDGKTKFNINKIDEKKYSDCIFFKERWINDDNLEQRLIVTYSVKYRNYHKKIREEQISRAVKLLQSNAPKSEQSKQTDYKRFITKTSVTKDGEIAENKIYTIDEELIAEESKYDGLYGVCTNLSDNAKEIIKINKRRWEIEESFRIMKTEFRSRPVYLSNDDRIKAHFITCFISLLIYRILEKQLEEKHTTENILSTLREMNFHHIKGEGYIPIYKRTDITDELHEKFGFRTDYQIVDNNTMKKILKNSKK